MAKNPVILEISHKEVKGVYYKNSLKGKTFLEANTHAFTTEDNAGRTDELIDFVKNNFKENNGIYFNLPVENIFFRELSLPFIDKKKVKEILPFELESLISYDIHDIVYDYYSYLDIDNNKTNILAACAKKESVLSYIKLFQKNMFHIKGIYAPHDSLFHLFPSTEKTSGIIVHISSLMTYILVIENNKWIFSRILPAGYDVLVGWLAQKWKKNLAESENLLLSMPKSDGQNPDYNFYKKHFQVTRAQAKLFMQTIDEFGEDIANELLSSERNASYKREKPEEELPIFLSTELKNQIFLENILSNKLKKTVSPFPYQKTPVSIFSRNYAIAIGAGMAQASSKKLDFFKGDIKKAGSLESKKSLGMLISISLGVLFFIVSIFLEYNQKAYKIDLYQENQKNIFQKYFNKKNIKTDRTLISQATEIVKKEKQNTEIFRIIQETPMVSKVLVDLHQFIPADSGLDIENINYDGKKITLTGSIADFQALTDFEKSLTDSGNYQKVETKNKRSMPAAEGKTVVKFTLILEPTAEKKEMG